jgi:hypothetical protein
MINELKLQRAGLLERIADANKKLVMELPEKLD